MRNRILSALLALCLLSGVPVLAEETVYSAQPIILTEYINVYASNMSLYIDPQYSDFYQWQLIEQVDGTLVVSDGIGHQGVHYVTLTVQGAHVKSITVSYPDYPDDPEHTSTMLTSWAVMALTPVVMRDGTDFMDAMDQAGMAYEAWAYDPTLPVCGMQATWTRTTGENAAVSVTFTFRQPRAELPLPAGEDLTQISAEGYMRALDDYALSLLDQRLVWTKPEELMGCTLYAVDSLRDVPTLMIRDDRILALVISVPPYEGQLQLTADTAQALTHLSLIPVLMVDGMTEAEAVDAFARWEEEVHFPSLLTSALSGVKCETEFYGFRVIIEYDGNLNIHLTTDAYWELEFNPDEIITDD